MKKTKIFLCVVLLFCLMRNFTNSQLIPLIPSCDSCGEEPEQILNNISTVTTGMDGIIPTLSVCGHDYNTDVDGCITMMDRNLGATSNDIEDISSYGEYYVRGNNYGFSRASSLNTGTDKIDCGNYGWQNPLNYNMFILTSYQDYCLSSNDNLWGGGLDTSGNNYDSQNPRFQRRGPCPVGYHVPSAGEWNALIDMWAGESVEGNLITSYISEFTNAFKIPRAGWLYRNGTFFNYGNYGHAYLWSSSPYQSNGWAYMIGIKDGMPINGVSSSYGDARANAVPIRCFKDVALKNKVSATVETGFKTTIGGVQYSGIPSTAVITTNTINKINGESVLGEVKVDFGMNEDAIFSHLVEVNVPVEDAEQVIIKVKHAGSSEYNYDGLTTNVNASCNNGSPTSNQYNGETITVVDGYATIYTCEASSFIALDVPPVEAQINLSVLKGTLKIGTDTGNLNLGQVNVSNTVQELSGSFGANSFWVEDMKGVESGYYTTISVTDLTGSVAGHVILADNVSLKTAGNEPSYISGAIVSEAKVIFGEGITTWHSGSGQVNYFQRLNTATEYAGRVGKWGDNLQIKVNIPAHTPSDTYRGTITYTLYDLDS